MYMVDVKKSVMSKTDPFKWWRVHKNVYPNLSKLARKWQGAVATSVPSDVFDKRKRGDSEVQLFDTWNGSRSSICLRKLG
ncbi:LOW QUALITY PROTEIN: Zinc finger BED domain containing hypothetical protein 1-like [Phytophthora palmivora]|uniref:HAT C-terminal dimerisation domain-containing protein n=1 Tax=Phytophthora palmivora TaxID=4796 RepID=A0A2P4Y9H9_9STRA|nr:LOW QUALITY PROTEIN: Zinc finger BED domain containing hypothetical protein 1-like [Phytophthora palmivora]